MPPAGVGYESVICNKLWLMFTPVPVLYTSKPFITLKKCLRQELDILVLDVINFGQCSLL